MTTGVVDIAVLSNFQKQVSDIERDAVWWLHTIVLKIFKPGKTEFVHWYFSCFLSLHVHSCNCHSIIFFTFNCSLHKVLFLEQPEHYYNKDNWPPESERM